VELRPWFIVDEANLVKCNTIEPKNTLFAFPPRSFPFLQMPAGTVPHDRCPRCRRRDTRPEGRELPSNRAAQMVYPSTCPAKERRRLMMIRSRGSRRDPELRDTPTPGIRRTHRRRQQRTNDPVHETLASYAASRFRSGLANNCRLREMCAPWAS